MNDTTLPARNDYREFIGITTRWHDNDIYGHVNNVIYYAWFDTAVNQYLLEQDVLDPHGGETIGLVVETQCRYFDSVVFPDRITAGIRVAHLGNSSVRYEIGLFKNDADSACAAGHFVHVYVDSTSRRPVALPDQLRSVLSAIQS